MILSKTLIACVALVTSLVPPTLAAQCYYTDGSKTDDSYEPCFPDRDDSPCCASHKSGNMVNDICLSSGLCLAQMKYYSGLVFQNACTDSNWRSSECPSICPGMSASSGIKILPCPAKGLDQWCCSTDGKDCCDNAKSVDIGTVMVKASTSTTTTKPSTSTSRSTEASGTAITETKTVTATSAATNCASAAGAEEAVCSNPNSDSKSTAIGAGVGAGLGVLLVAALSALWLQRRTYEKKLLQHPEIMESTGGSGSAIMSPIITYPVSRDLNQSSGAPRDMVELQSHNFVQEVQGSVPK